MARQTITARQNGGGAPALLLAAAVALLALPSAVLALTGRADPRGADAPAEVSDGGFQPAEVDPRLARSITVRALSRGRVFQFTPASTLNRLERSVTVAVRLDGARGVRAGAETLSGLGALRIAPGGYNLDAARGARAGAAGVAGIRKIDMPDLASFRPSAGAQDDPSRLAPRIALDERQKSGRAPRTFEQSDQTVDLGGSYRVTRNLDVTAGVRYSSDRDRLRPLIDGRQDSQAVYVGTQFRF